MHRDKAAVLYDIYERALRVLAEADPVLWELADDKERESFHDAHSHVVVAILSRLRAPLVIEHRDLDTSKRPEGPPDTVLDAQELEAARCLTMADIERIDQTLLSQCGPSWLKVARVVGSAMTVLANAFPDIADGFYAQRIVILAGNNLLESQGNLDYMRYSEVRLPARTTATQSMPKSAPG